MAGDGQRRPRRTGGPPTKHRATYLDDATYRRAQALAARAGLSYSGWVSQQVNAEYLKNQHDEEEE